jgi:predicted MFS family arabinose efflux permease
MGIIDHWGYQANWAFMGLLGVIAFVLGIWTLRLVNQEKINL